MADWRPIAALYALVAAVAAGLAGAFRHASPLVHPEPWASLDEPSRSLASAAMGLALGALVSVSARWAVLHWSRARSLHAELRPVARSLAPGGILALAVASSAGEELFFRALLAPAIGVVAQAALFGLAHQIRGPGRWLWVGWAAGVGLALGAIFALTGSLAGPLLAHAVVNAHGLAFLRDHDPGAAPPRLGGLMARS
jgi:membrane protease YdiL (CAAX protease family)